MKKSKELRDFNRREYIGDGLLSFIARKVICKDFSDRKIQKKSTALVFKCTSNETLGAVAFNIGIPPYDGEPRNFHKGTEKTFADALEVKLYDIYVEEGMESAEQFFIQNILSYVEKEQQVFSSHLP